MISLWKNAWALIVYKPGRIFQLREKGNKTLPIFSIEMEKNCLIYTPGHLAVVKPEEAETIQCYWNIGRLSSDVNSHTKHVAHAIEKCAQQAEHSWRELSESPFMPECLTIYLSNS